VLVEPRAASDRWHASHPRVPQPSPNSTSPPSTRHQGPLVSQDPGLCERRRDMPGRLQPGWQREQVPHPSSRTPPAAISIRTDPSRTKAISRRSGVHGTGPSTSVNRVRPAHTPSARTSSRSSLPGTSGSGSHPSVPALTTNTPGCSSISSPRQRPLHHLFYRRQPATVQIPSAMLLTQRATGDATPDPHPRQLPSGNLVRHPHRRWGGGCPGGGIRQHPDASPVLLNDPVYVGVAVTSLPSRPGFHRVRTPQVDHGRCRPQSWRGVASSAPRGQVRVLTSDS
jgi:hypothetical protein